MLGAKRYLILGPEDHNELPMGWKKWRGWVEQDKATLYDRDYVFSFPPSELPTGGVGIQNVRTGRIYTPRPGRDGSE